MSAHDHMCAHCLSVARPTARPIARPTGWPIVPTAWSMATDISHKDPPHGATLGSKRRGLRTGGNDCVGLALHDEVRLWDIDC
eukprot:9875657-Alexandrium_andersonii.AAC.2